MDPITIVSVLGTVVQFVDFSSKVLSKSAEIYRSGKGALTENADIETTAADLSKLNTRLKQSTSIGDPDLQALCQACGDISDQLPRSLG